MIKGELVRATATWRQAHFSAVMSRSLQLPCTTSREDREVGKEITPSTGSDPAASRGFCLKWCLGTSLYYPKGYNSPVWDLASTATQVSRDTACRSMGLLNQHKAPNCLPLWFQLLPMGNCTQGLVGYRSALETWVPTSYRSLRRPLLARLLLPIRYPWWSSQWRPQVGLPVAHKRDGSWEH